MGVHLSLLNKQAEWLGDWWSKPLEAFCSGLELYCNRAMLSNEERDNWVGVNRWFLPVFESMSEPLCLLALAVHAPWDYSADEYERYLIENQEGFSEYSFQEFLQQCDTREQVDPWMYPEKMRAVVDDLIDTLETSNPEETWWYSADHLIPSLKELSIELQKINQLGIEEVRFGIL